MTGRTISNIYLKILHEAYEVASPGGPLLNDSKLTILFNDPISQEAINLAQEELRVLRPLLINALFANNSDEDEFKLYNALYLLAHLFPEDSVTSYSLSSSAPAISEPFVTAHGKTCSLPHLLNALRILQPFPNLPPNSFARLLQVPFPSVENRLCHEILNDFLPLDIERLKMLQRKQQWGIHFENFFIAGIAPGCLFGVLILSTVSVAHVITFPYIIISVVISLIALTFILTGGHDDEHYARLQASLFNEFELKCVGLVGTFFLVSLGLLVCIPPALIYGVMGLGLFPVLFHFFSGMVCSGLTGGVVSAFLSIVFRDLINYLASPVIAISKQDEQFFKELKPLTSQIGKNFSETPECLPKPGFGARISSGLKNFSLFSSCCRKTDSALPLCQRELLAHRI